MRSLLTITLLAASAASFAQTAERPAPGPIPFPTVAAARQALEARDGDGTVVTHPDGWTVVNEPLASAQWSFVPEQHAAYPAVVRRVILRGADGKASVDTASLCEAPKPACEQLLVEFASMNDRIVQATQARGRRPATPPPAPAQ